MKKNNPRIPEGGAITDTQKMDMEKYSEIMKKKLNREYNRFAENVLKKVSPVEHAKTLEIGPGPGWAGIALLKRRKDISLQGLEASSDMIRVAKKNAVREEVDKRAIYRQGTGENMSELSDQSFDLVISRDSLHHWDDPVKVFKEINRVLKPGGKIFIHDSRRDMNFGGKLIVHLLGPIIAGNMCKYWKSSIAASYTPDEINELLNTNNLPGWQVISEFMDLNIIKK